VRTFGHHRGPILFEYSIYTYIYLIDRIVNATLNDMRIQNIKNYFKKIYIYIHYFYPLYREINEMPP